MKNGFAVSILFLFLLPAVISAAEPDVHSLVATIQQGSQAAYDSITSLTFEGRMHMYVYLSIGTFDFRKVVFHQESVFRAYWLPPDSLRIIYLADRSSDPESLRTARQWQPNPFPYTHSLTAIKSPTDSSRTRWPLYPFAAGADSVYNYRILNTVRQGDDRIITIHVSPRDNQIPAVIGTYRIDPDRAVVVGSNVRFNEASRFSRVSARRDSNRFSLGLGGRDHFNIHTDYMLFNKKYWLPVRVKEIGGVSRLGVSAVMERIIHFDSYFVNDIAPDSLSDQRIVFRPDSNYQYLLPAVNPDSLQDRLKHFLNTMQDEHLSEQLIRNMIRSQFLRPAVARTMLEQGFGRYLTPAKRLGDFIQYNRVDGLRLSYGIRFHNLLPRSLFGVSAGYGFSDRKWKAEVAWLQHLDARQRWSLESNFFHTLSTDNAYAVSTGANTISSLVFKDDYHDYFYKRGLSLSLGFRLTEHIAITAGLLAHHESNARRRANFSLFDWKGEARPNPAIVAGDFRGVQTTFRLTAHQIMAMMELIHSSRAHFRSDFQFTRLQGRFRYRLPIRHTGLIVLSVAGGVSRGVLPPQYWFDFGGPTFLDYYGHLRTVTHRSFTGDRMLTGAIDYLLPLSSFLPGWPLVNLLQLSPWFGGCWSDLSKRHQHLRMQLQLPGTSATDGFYEAGIGLSDRFHILRLDIGVNNQNDRSVRVKWNILR